jgi:N-carbamoylputrescine amidase
VARELGVVLPISWFERAGNSFFNSLAMIDADGSVLGVLSQDAYSQFHRLPGEAATSRPEIRDFRVWNDALRAYRRRASAGTSGFPEAARCMALHGAEVLLYPTAIGSEPGAPELDSSGHWCRTMQGHAAANIVPLVASNRIGREVATGDASLQVDFYGSSFIADHTGALVNQADDASESVLVATFDLDAVARYRREWGVFRDRRPECYEVITTHGEA